MADRYGAIGAFLTTRPPEVRLVVLPFRELEALLGAPLPRVARQRRTWWAADRAWRLAGWRVVRVDLDASLVEFERTG